MTDQVDPIDWIDQVPEPTKRCSRCGEDKPHGEFYKHSTTSDGLQPRCKQCDRVALSRISKAAAARVEHKACTKCGKSKPMSRFSRSRNAPDGHHNHCKDCHREYYLRKKARATAAAIVDGGQAEQSIDVDAINALIVAGDEFNVRFGFRPTHAQTIMWLMHMALSERTSRSKGGR